MAGVTQAWWAAAVKALTAWLDQSANEDLHTLQINCPKRVTLDSPKLVDCARPSAGSIGPGWEERQACLDSGYRESNAHPGVCVKKVEAVYVYEKKGAFRTMLKYARVVCGVQLLIERYLDIHREPSEE